MKSFKLHLTGEENNNWVIWLVVIVLICGLYILFTEDDSSKTSESQYVPVTSYNADSNVNHYDSGPYGSDASESTYEPENPYSGGSGHSAGYEWAQENDVNSCGGNSNSFIEGCEEYLSQKEEASNYGEE